MDEESLMRHGLLSFVVLFNWKESAMELIMFDQIGVIITLVELGPMFC